MRGYGGLAVIAGCGLAAMSARADQLILNDGTVLEGQVERQGEMYSLVGSDGAPREVSAEQVKRYIFESRVTAAQAAEMLEAVLELAGPALAAQEPTPHSWLREQGSQGESSEAQGQYGQGGFAGDMRLGSGGFGLNLGGYAQGQSSLERNSNSSQWQHDTLRRREFDAVFLDEWVRYTALFESLGRNPRFRALVDSRRGSGSLREFSRYASTDNQVAAEVLQEALQALDQCLELAEETQQRLSRIPLQQLEAERDLLDLQADVARERARIWTALDRLAQERRAQRAENRLREHLSEMQYDLLNLTRTAERRMNLFAQEREVARGHLQTAARVLGVQAGAPPIRP